jgi:nucleotide-binding universal stress UspA family protein
MPLSRILVPVDFSERSKGAARFAAALHTVFGGEIRLLHVLPPPRYDFGALEVAGTLLEEQLHYRDVQSRKDLAEFLVDELDAESTVRQVEDGDPATVIVAQAQATQTSLIVMPTHGYGPFRRFILGSVTAKVLHDADCPVLTGVHMEAPSAAAIHFRQVTAAIDLGPQSERTLMWAARFAKDSGARLAVVHAIPQFEDHSGEFFDPDWRRHVEEAVREEISKLLERLHLEAPLHVESGETSRSVCDAAASLESNLLVIGRGSAAGVFGRLRANAYSIIRQSQCPVVSV